MSVGESAVIGVLASGGLDSSILLGQLLRQGARVQPFYIRTGLIWQEYELAALQQFLAGIAAPQLLPLVTLDLPLLDLYEAHWSVTGRDVPGVDTPDEAVFLPGRNALLIVKAAIWCQLHKIDSLALAPLGSSPFEDAGPEFIHEFQSAMNRGAAHRVELLRPFSGMHKLTVMKLGHGLPLERTFSCMAPERGRHCGRCNKCEERRAAFAAAEIVDRTDYASAREAA